MHRWIFQSSCAAFPWGILASRWSLNPEANVLHRRQCACSIASFSFWLRDNLHVQKRHWQFHRLPKWSLVRHTNSPPFRRYRWDDNPIKSPVFLLLKKRSIRSRWMPLPQQHIPPEQFGSLLAQNALPSFQSTWLCLRFYRNKNEIIEGKSIGSSDKNLGLRCALLDSSQRKIRCGRVARGNVLCLFLSLIQDAARFE